MKRTLFLMAGFLLIAYSNVYSDCYIQPPTQPSIISIKACRVIFPEQEKVLTDFKKKYVEGFTANKAEYAMEAQKIVDSYEGAVLKAVIDQKSSKGLSKETHVFLKTKKKNICDQLVKTPTIEAFVYTACCDGDPNVPCYLNVDQYIDEVLTFYPKE